MGKVIMGSTDIRTDDPVAARCNEDEIEYMMTSLRGVFPQVRIAREQIVYAICGVRPLPASGTDVLANVSRGHSVRVVEPEAGRAFPILCLIGGKWTTFRAFAEQVADQVLVRLGLARRRSSEHLPIGGGVEFPADGERRAAWVRRVAKATGLAEVRVEVLLDRYGVDAEAYAAGASAEAERPFRSLPSYTVGEIERIARDDYVEHLEDLVCRRSTIALLGEAREESLRELAGIAGRVLGWDAARREDEVRRVSPLGDVAEGMDLPACDRV
jgi:glycerol-3-phosphate dehydrogenase